MPSRFGKRVDFCVGASALSLTLFQIGAGPVFELIENWLQRFSVRTKTVLHLWRDLWIHFPHNDFVIFELSQLLGQHSLRNIRDYAVQLVEPHGLAANTPQDHPFPFSANQTKGGFSWAKQRINLLVLSHGNAY
jgi:hypothetical protein